MNRESNLAKQRRLRKQCEECGSDLGNPDAYRRRSQMARHRVLEEESRRLQLGRGVPDEGQIESKIKVTRLNGEVRYRR